MKDLVILCIPSNDDVDGIGVRLGFYIQTIMSVAILWLSEESAIASLFNLLILSVAYTVSTVVNVWRPPHGVSLHLYHVIQASYLVWLANLSLLIGFGVYSRRNHQRRRPPDTATNTADSRPSTDEELAKIMVGRLGGIQIAASWCLSVCMWVRADSIGAVESKELRDRTRIFIIYGYHLQATSNGRVAALISLGIIMTLYLAFIIHTIARNMAWRPRFWRNRHVGVNAELKAATRLAEKHHLPEEHIVALQMANRVPLTRFRAFEVAFFVVYVPIFVGFIVAIELQRSRNDLCDSSGAWGFGQITALLTSAWTISDGVKVGRKVWLKRKLQS